MSDLLIPSGVAAEIQATVAAAGLEGVETGGFIIGAPDDEFASTLAIAGDAGIKRESRLFIVSGLAMAALLEWTAEQELTVAAQWHSHRFNAFLSSTDLRYGFKVSGFRTSVVPDYLDPSADPADWGWWICDGSDWNTTEPPRLITGEHKTVIFEEGGVDERG